MLYLETGTGLTLADTVRANGVIIDVGGNANPEVQDWNEDGKKDLIIGAEDGAGTMLVYLNQGTDDNPVFTTYSYIMRAGNPIYHYRGTERIFDLDNDGKKDLITSDQSSYVYFYRNTGTDASPVFETVDTLRLTTSAFIHEYQAMRVFCCDFNGDGAVDLWTSDFDGFIRYYQNTVFYGVDEAGSSARAVVSVTPSITGKTAQINYALKIRTKVIIDLYTADGRRVERIAEQTENAGNHRLTWDRKDLESGIYFIRVTTGGSPEMRKIVLL